MAAGWTNRYQSEMDLRRYSDLDQGQTCVQNRRSAAQQIEGCGIRYKLGNERDPYAVGGNAQGLAVQGINGTNMPGLAGTATAGNQLLMANLLTFLSGSIGSVSQLYFLNSADDVTVE